ncbi:prisilkin-39-like isoform X2 [Toxotes jaculatrix]|uniref:prisilkin-39-like isoform X2 n=1 Tax=Toxotes jaculatrix TaxID=941984 RepID=UPI001B3AE11B|nr:prisilkin-39-like isoform X2 [Toxotes jaculatrix]
MMLWIVCLLIGGITCAPVEKDYGSEGAPSGATSFNPQPAPLFAHWGGAVSSDVGSSSLSSLPIPSSYVATGGSADSGYPSFRDEGYSSPGVVYAASHTGGYDSGAPSAGYGGGYGGSAGGYAVSGSYGFDPAPGGEDLSAGPAAGDGAGVEAPEPVFSDVSDLEPVYSFGSRSSYQRGRSVFAQTSYIPGEPVLPPMPVYRHAGKTSKVSSSSDVPAKGGF